MIAAAADPIPVADDLCELLMHADWAQHRDQFWPILDGAGAGAAAVVAEVARRGFLERLVPADETANGARLFDRLLDGGDVALRAQLAAILIARGGLFARGAAGWLFQRADGEHALAPLYAALIAAGHYDALLSLLGSGGPADESVLALLAAARPSWNEDALNAPALAAARAACEYDLLIVPGYTPLDAKQPIGAAALPAACKRLDLARAELDAGRAPLVLVTGAAVHPPGTAINEALSMRDYLVNQGTPPARVLVEPYARHSTTNLRNAGRMMRRLGLARALILTGFESEVFDQAFYFANPVISTFNQRCRSQLGYLVGTLDGAGDHRIAFTPSDGVDTIDNRDPLDW